LIKAFHVSDVLTAATGKLYSLRGMEGVYDIMSHLAGEELVTHQLVRALGTYRPVLSSIFPELAATELPEVHNTKELNAFISGVVKVHGETVQVPSFPEFWESVDPVAELAAMWADKR
jgi:hypothetical protein